MRPTPGAAETVFLCQKVDKTLGFNAPNKYIKPQKDYFVANDAQKALLNNMNPNFSTWSIQTTYLFINKPRIIQLHDQAKILDVQFDAIKQAVAAQNLDWDNLPNIYEKYTIGDLGSWEYRQ